MSGTLYTLSKKPLGLWALGTTTNFVDYTGLGNVGTQSGTPVLALSASHGTRFSNTFDNTRIGTFPAAVFKQGAENKPFSLNAKIVPINTGTSVAEQQILGNNGQMDGLTIAGTVVSFVTKYADGSECRCSYDLQTNRRVDIMGVHGQVKNTLFIDGVVATETLLTQAQLQPTATYKGSNANLYSGACSNTQGFSMNNVGVWNVALTSQDVRDIYNHCYLPNKADTWSRWGGKEITITQRPDTIFNIDIQNTNDQFNHGETQNVTVSNDRITPNYDNNVSIPGYWIASYPLFSYTGGTIFGVNINWRAIGVKMEVSLDGTTWETIYRGQNVSTVSAGTDPTNKMLLIRATFPGGLANDPSYLTQLTVTGFKTNVSSLLSQRTVTFGNADISLDQPPYLRITDSGLTLKSSNVSIGPDTTDTPFNPKTVEYWIRPIDNVSYSTNLTGTTVYINGSTGGTLRLGEWNLIHETFGTEFSGTFTFTANGKMQLTRLIYYRDQFSAAQVSALYGDYTGTNILSVYETTSFGISEPTTAAQLYAHDWAITAAG